QRGVRRVHDALQRGHGLTVGTRAKLVGVLLLALGVLGVLILATSKRQQLAEPAAGGVVERSLPPAAGAPRLPAPEGGAAAPRPTSSRAACASSSRCWRRSRPPPSMTMPASPWRTSRRRPSRTTRRT